MEKITYKLEAFEGPLDLLLLLINKNKLNIYDINISELLEQYMEYINNYDLIKLDVESEFLEMAARLVYIKSVSLLPKQQEAKELQDKLKDEILEYKKYKQIAQDIALKANYDIFIREQEEVILDNKYIRKHETCELVKAYLNAVGRGKRRLPVPQEAFTGIVKKKVIPVSKGIKYVLNFMFNKKEVEFISLFNKGEERPKLVATFLAVLELIKERKIKVINNNKKTKLELINGGAEYEN